MSSIKLQSGFKPTQNSCVFENKRGERIHTFGLLRNAQGKTYPPDQTELRTYMMLMGGNRKRALMACMEFANG